MTRIVFLFIVSIISTPFFSQITCKGVLLDSATLKPIEFANIGIVGKGIGTVTNEKGEYLFVVPDSLADQKVRMSLIGYKPKTMIARYASAKSKIVLVQEAANLDEVIVTVKKTKIKILGNNTTHSGVTGGFTQNNLGAEMAVKLNITHPKTQLRKFMVNITACTLDKAMFRLNFYSVDEKGYPKENILKQNIIIEPKEKTGLIEVDLKPYNIFIDEDVFVALEWIKDLGNVKGLTFSTKLVGNGTYFRKASQDAWQKTHPIGVGLHVEAAY
ncbi:MAG: carboxypeptidase-like regulatory domain-containing protein [Bacteroidia bacterium]